MTNFIFKKISDCMEQSQPTFTIPRLLGKDVRQFHEMPIQKCKPVKEDRMLFQAYTYLGILQKKGKHGSQVLIQTFCACGNQMLPAFVKITEAVTMQKSGPIIWINSQYAETE